MHIGHAAYISGSIKIGSVRKWGREAHGRSRHEAHLESLGAAGHGGEDIVAVHRSQDEAGSVPGLGAGAAAHRGGARGAAAACLQAAHAHGRQELRATLHLHLQQQSQPHRPSCITRRLVSLIAYSIIIAKFAPAILRHALFANRRSSRARRF